MKSPFQRRTAFVAALLAPALAACGFGAQTDQIYQAAQGVDDRTTSVKILNALVVAAENGSGTFAGSFVNESDESQELSEITGEGVTAAISEEAVAVAPKTLLNLGEPVVGPRGGELPQVVLSGTAIEIGRYVRLTLTFSGVGAVTINVPVVSNDSDLGHEFLDVPVPPSTSAPEASDEPSEEATEESAEGHAE